VMSTTYLVEIRATDRTILISIRTKKIDERAVPMEDANWAAFCASLPGCRKPRNFHKRIAGR
jgi:hypothetical protein